MWKEGENNNRDRTIDCCLSESHQFSITKFFRVFNVELNTDALVVSFYHIVYFRYFKELRRKLKLIDIIIQKTSKKRIFDNCHFLLFVSNLNLLHNDVHQIALYQKFCYNHYQKF